jgi:hypothetical protein
MRWRNRGTYGWIYTRTKFTGKRYDESLWLTFDYYDTSIINHLADNDVNMRIGRTNSWNEAWDSNGFLFRTHSSHANEPNSEPYKSNWNHKEIKFT